MCSVSKLSLFKLASYRHFWARRSVWIFGPQMALRWKLKLRKFCDQIHRWRCDATLKDVCSLQSNRLLTLFMYSWYFLINLFCSGKLTNYSFSAINLLTFIIASWRQILDEISNINFDVNFFLVNWLSVIIPRRIRNIPIHGFLLFTIFQSINLWIFKHAL